MGIEPPLGRYRIRLRADVAEALRTGAPVVALESTIISHGLPRPRNVEVAAEIENTVRSTGAVPATIGIIGGEIVAGLDADQVKHLALTDGVAKASVRDLPVVAAKKLDGATTVASTAAIAAAVGIPVFATGGLGGVHRDASTTFDESADLGALSRTPIAVVCAGVKSILDVPATLERLESTGVTVLGYRTNRFPGFYLSDSGYEITWRAEDPAEVADTLRATRELKLGDGAVVVANPLPVDEQLDPALHDRVLAEGLAGLEREGVTGKDVTPYLLAHFHSATEGESLTVNTRIILRNAELAGQIAVAFAGSRTAHA